ncbi:sulfatase-like hydrolase/transferase [Kluyvera cryocrescens]|nr:sulfatase-like hydrolase/transferase [Kluyvera cryocrescens]
MTSDYDDTLIPELKQALNRGGKQVIVLHLYGSHEPECVRFPAQEAIFDAQDSGIDACYDNSIRYTDKLLGQMFSLLEGRRASLVYFSDHTLERDPQKRVVYYHGGVKPSQHAYQVPMFVWYSKQVAKPENGEVKALYSTAHNFQLMRYWLGIRLPNETLPGTLKSRASQLAGQVPVLDTTNTVYDWKQLRR